MSPLDLRLALPAAVVSAGLFLAAADPSWPAAAPAPETAKPALSDDCFAELEKGTGAEIACYFPMLLTADERKDLQRITRQYLQDLTCRLEVRIERAAIDAALRAKDHVFQSPEQPVSCKVTTKSSTFDVTATFAPRVVFKDDKAIDGSPGLGNVTGVSRILSWPVVQYVNRGPGMRSQLLLIVNAYREHARRKAKETTAP